MGTKTQNRRCSTVVLCLQHVLHLQGPACPSGRVQWGSPSSLQGDTVPIPSEHTWLGVALAASSLLSHLCCVIAGCGTFVVRTLYSGMLSNRRGNWYFLWVNFGSPDTKNSAFGLQNRQSSCGEFGSCPYPSPIWADLNTSKSPH